MTSSPEKPIWPTLLEIASKQEGVLARRQAAAAGCTRADWTRFVRLGRLRALPFHRGIHEAQPPGNWFKRELRALLLSAGPGAVVSHRAAACLYKFWGIEGYPLEITIPPKRKRIDGPFLLHSTPLPVGDVETYKDLPVTSVSRTLCDLASVLDPDMLAVAFESVRRGRSNHIPILAEHLKAHPRAHQGADALLALLADSAARPWRSMESPFEVLMWRRLRLSGIPLPRPQVPFKSGNTNYFIDFAWEERKVAIEVDGYGFHSSRQAYAADARKMAALKRAGWIVLKIWWERYLGDLPGFFAELRDDLKLPWPRRSRPSARARPLAAKAA